MAVKISTYNPGTGVLGSKAFSAGMGFVTGGPVGAAAALAGSGNPAMGRALGAAKMAMGQAPDAEEPEEEIQRGDVPEPPADPMQRRMDQLSQQPTHVIQRGLEALNDPSTPDYIKQQYAEPLLRAKYAIGGTSRY